MNGNKKAVFFGALIIITITLIATFDLQQYFTRDSLLSLQDSNLVFGPILFVLLYVVATVAFLPASILSLAAGAIFGTVFGTIYVVIGAIFGATISFLLARFFVRDFVEEKIVTKFPALKKYDGQFEKRAASIIFILRLAPIVPFSALNYFLGITKSRTTTYVMASLIGILPGTIAYVYFGEALASFSVVNILMAIMFMVILSVGALIYNKVSIDRNDDEYDIIVIGAGSGGLNIASFMNKAGFKTLLIDKSDANIGGDCLNFGCVPSKALLHVAKQVKAGKESKEFGMNMEGVIDMSKVRNYIHGKREYIREHENADYFRKQGMNVVLGAAKFASKHTVSVGEKEYTAKRIVLATGSRPFVPPIKGLDAVSYHTNETIFDIEILPKKLLVVGGGPIGTELGQAFQLLGSEVHIVQNSDMLLGREDVDMAKIVMNQLKNDGILLHLEQQVSEIKVVNGKKVAILKNKDDSTEELVFDEILIATGRQLNIENLALEKAGIKKHENGRKLLVDDYLRTTNKRVFVCGDIVGQHQFTHAAELHAGLLLKNFFTPKPFNKKLTSDSLSWVTYTSPSLGTFGIQEQTLKDRGTSYTILETDFSHDDRAIVDSYMYGHLKLFVAKNNTLLGGTMVAPHAGELIQELILLQSQGMKIDALFNKIYPYPTASRINKSVVAKHFSSKLTSLNKKLLKVLY